MMQTYTGRVKAGRFFPHSGQNVPDCSIAVLVVQDIPQIKNRRQEEAMRRFREEIQNCNEPVPEFERIKFREVEI
jgi:hypothetical protein